MYRAGIIGCGFIGVEAPDNHAQAYIDCPDTELKFLCDTDSIKLREICVKLQIGGWITYQDTVETQGLDIVSVCTPPETHCQIVCDISPYVKAIYCEKPIALTLEDTDRMIETCHKHNVILQINHQRSFIRPVMRFSRGKTGLLSNATHAFALLGKLGILSKGRIEYIDTKEPIFELDISQDRMILLGVQFLVDCLANGWQSDCSGEDGREALKLALEFKERYERNK